MSWSLSISSGQVFAAELRGLGVDTKRIWARLHPENQDIDGTRRMSATVVHRMIESLVAEPGHADVLLRAIERRDADDYGALGLALQTSDTLQSALLRLARYLDYWTTDFDLAFISNDSEIDVGCALRATPCVGVSWVMACALAAALHHGRQITGLALIPSAVWIHLERPADTSTWERIFQGPVHFSADRTAMQLSEAELDVPLPGAHEAMAEFFDTYLGEALTELRSRGAIVAEVARIVSSLLPEGELTLERVASRMGVGPRTLQRRLSDEDVNYKDLVDRVRHETALRLLAATTLGVAEVGYVLGFGNPSSFNRACRRWTGSPPGDIRRGLHSSPGVAPS